MNRMSDSHCIQVELVRDRGVGLDITGESGDYGAVLKKQWLRETIYESRPVLL